MRSRSNGSSCRACASTTFSRRMRRSLRRCRVASAPSGPCPPSGEAATRELQAVDPVVLPERGKADTRSGRTTGSTAGGTAPGRLFRWSGKDRTAHAALSTSDRNFWRWCSESRCEHRRRPRTFLAESASLPCQATCAVSRAIDPGPFPARVSAFPLAGRRTGPGARHSLGTQRLVSE